MCFEWNVSSKKKGELKFIKYFICMFNCAILKFFSANLCLPLTISEVLPIDDKQKFVCHLIFKTASSRKSLSSSLFDMCVVWKNVKGCKRRASYCADEFLWNEMSDHRWTTRWHTLHIKNKHKHWKITWNDSKKLIDELLCFINNPDAKH